MLFKWTVALSPAAKALISCDHNLETASFDVGQTLRESLFLFMKKTGRDECWVAQKARRSSGYRNTSVDWAGRVNVLPTAVREIWVWRINQPGGVKLLTRQNRFPFTFLSWNHICVPTQQKLCRFQTRYVHQDCFFCFSSLNWLTCFFAFAVVNKAFNCLFHLIV